MAAGDLKESRSVSHSIKGSAGNLRVNEVYRIAKAMQDEADNENLDQLKVLVVELRKHSDEFLAEVAGS